MIHSFKRQISFVLISILFAIPAHTSETPYDRLSMREKKDYDFVIQTCHLDIEALATITESTKNDSIDYFSALFPDPSIVSTNDNLVARKGLGKNTNRLLNSYGYFLGLKTCFPNSENQRHLYTVNLLLFDAFGKAATLSIVGATGAGLYRGLAFLGRKLAIAPTVLLFRKLNASEPFLAKLPTYMGKVGVYSFNVITLASIADYIYELKKDLKIKEVIAEADDPISIRQNLQINLNLYNSSLKLRAQAQTPQEQATIDALIKDQKQIVIYYIDSLLAADKLAPQEKEKLLNLKKKFS